MAIKFADFVREKGGCPGQGGPVFELAAPSAPARISLTVHRTDPSPQGIGHCTRCSKAWSFAPRSGCTWPTQATDPSRYARKSSRWSRF